jgi:hypothetical protein
MFLNEVTDFLATTPSADEILAFRFSAEAQTQSNYLLDKRDRMPLSSEEQTAVDEYIMMNNLVNTLKAKIRRKGV